MKKLSFVAVIILLSSFFKESFGQTCPTCIVDESVHTDLDPELAGLVPDEFTIQAGEDTTFSAQYLFPTEIDAGIAIATVTSVQILNIVGLPPNTSLTWLCDSPGTNCTYFPQDYRYGCVQLCINTLAPAGTYTLNVRVEGCGSALGISQCQIQNIPVTINVLPPAGNPFFQASSFAGCDSLEVDFEQTVPPLSFMNPTSFEWVIEGDTTPGETITHNFVGTGEYPVDLLEVVDEFYISEISFSTTDIDCWCDVPNLLPFGGPCVGDSYRPYVTINTGGAEVTLPDNSNGSWSGLDIPIESSGVSLNFYEADNVFADDNMGSALVAYSSTPNPGSFPFSNSCVDGSFTIERRQKTINVYSDTISILPESVEPVITNLDNDIFCEGDTIILESTPSEAYQWFVDDTTEIVGATNQTLMVTESGSYSVQVTDSGTICSAKSANYEVEVEQVPTPTYTRNDELGIIFVNNPNNYNVAWYSLETGSPIPIPGANSDTLTNYNTEAASFLVELTSDAGCVYTTINTVERSITEFNLFPNPNNGTFTVKFDVVNITDIKINVLDITGRLIYNENISNALGTYDKNINLGNGLSTGFYIFNLQSENFSVQKHFIVE